MTKEKEILEKFNKAHEGDPKPGANPAPADPEPEVIIPDPVDPPLNPGDDTKPGDPQPLELNDESVFGYLSKQQGREIKSIADLIQEKEVEKIVERPIDYANEQVQAIDKFVKDTGRNPEDFFSLQKDWTKVSDDVVAREYLKSQKPGLTDEDLGDLVKIRYKPDQVLDDEGVVLNSKEIKLAGLDYKDVIATGRQFFEQEKSKYSVPVDPKRNEIADNWRGRVDAMLNSDKVEVKTGEQSYVLTDKTVLKKRYESLDTVLKDRMFTGEDGKFDPTKFISILEKGVHAEAIVKNALTDAETRIRETVLKDLPEPGNKPGEKPLLPGDSVKGMKPDQKQKVLDTARRANR